MKKLYSLLILSFVLLNLCACSYQAPQQKSKVLLDLPSLLSNSQDMTIDKAKQQIKEAYDKGYIIGYDVCPELGQNYKEFTNDRGRLQLNGFTNLAVCIPCKKGSFSLEELKELLKRYGIQQPLNERTTICKYKAGFHSDKSFGLLPKELGDEFTIYCTDRVADKILKYSTEHNLSIEEESAFYAQGVAYKYSVQKTDTFLFVTLNTRFEGPIILHRLTDTNGVKGWPKTRSEDLRIIDDL